ncbi:hypothetical protein [uncultured Muribaculum sp.]|uniref:hypothetical protein n=1 Tax=uncultured Muribaculum sp. TaxID=1918613 RepID=UPI00338E2774
MQKVTVDDVVEYLERSIAERRHIKILSTPESFHKVKQAFEELEENPYVRCFMLLDECQKYVQDNDYREDITMPIEDFFKFDNKAMVSATPIIPSDPRFEQQGFSLVQIIPDYEYRKDISIIHTNNVLEALKVTIPQILKAQTEPRSICFFINSTDMIYQLIEKLGITEQSTVFCATKSVDKLKRKGFKCAYENWDKAHMKQYNFFTSRFYTALDIELEEKPDVVFVTEPYFSEYTAIDPSTDVVQSIGRFRNGTSFNTHIVNTHSGFPIRTKEGIKEYLQASAYAYKILQNLYECATSIETRYAYKAALDVLPFQQMMHDGQINYFAIDNYTDEELVKSAYNSFNLLLERYNVSGTLNPQRDTDLIYQFGDSDRLKLEKKSGKVKEARQEIVAILETLKNDTDSELVQSHIAELRQIDPFIVEAYESVGKEVIEINNYSRKKIKEAMILKKYHNETSGIEFVQLLKNSFHSNQKYSRKYIKQELERIYAILGIAPKKTITAQSIRDFFNVRECKLKGQRAYQLLEPLI